MFDFHRNTPQDDIGFVEGPYLDHTFRELHIDQRRDSSYTGANMRDQNTYASSGSNSSLPLAFTGIALILIFAGCILLVSGCCSKDDDSTARGSDEDRENETMSPSQLRKVKRQKRKAYIADILKKEIFTDDTKGTKIVSVDLGGSSDSGTSTCSASVSFGDDDSINSMSNRPQCAICLDNFCSGDEICSSPSANCGHEFHYKCILLWLAKHDDCPMCRQQFLDSKALEDIEAQVVEPENHSLLTTTNDNETIQSQNDS